jgi:tetratricopeptide (TPR) repeat protein
MAASSSSSIGDAIAALQSGNLELARALAERQLQDGPGSAQLQHVLGLIECRSGRLESGIDHLRQAAGAEPDNLAYRVMLARALNDSGRASEAFAVSAPPTGTSPPELALWHVHAEAAQALGDHANAEQAWKILCAARLEDWRAWANYGDALAGLDRWADAANALRQAAALNPNESPLQEKLASALARAGFYEEAADRLGAMLDAGPDDAGIRLTLARLLADLGRQEDSMAQLERAAQVAVGGAASGKDEAGLIRIALGDWNDASEPPSARNRRSLRELALLLERTNRMEALRNLLDEAEGLGIAREELGYPAAAVALRDGDAGEAKGLLELEDSAPDPVRWNRLMAKILDSLGDPEGAFAAAETMNRAVSDFDGWVRRGAEYRRRIRALAATVTPEWSAKLRPLESGLRAPPAFLVGFPRSGTTLLDTFLMGHPDTEVIEERHMLGAAETVLGDIAQLPLRPLEQLRQARKAYLAELDRHVDQTFTGLIVDKLPLNMLGLSAIHSLFPDARIIFAQRHPCDAVLSGFMQSFTLNDAMACFLTIEDAADFYDAAMSLFTRSRNTLPLASHTLVYEELIADPARALKPLIAFLGLEWRPELLDHRATAKARGAIITPSYDQVIQPLNKAPSGRWRRYEKQLEPVLPVLLPWAERLGYSD